MSAGMHRQLRLHLRLLLHHYRFPLLMQITTLSDNMQSVLEFAHE